MEASSTTPHHRAQPGERRLQVLQALAKLLELPGGERVTTAALANSLQVSEAALYRHFASKAQMFEGLLDFIEQSVFSLIGQIETQPQCNGAQRAMQMVAMLMKFAEKNPGMTRVMVGDALLLEHERLQERMNLFFDKVEAAFKQCLRDEDSSNGAASTQNAHLRATVLMAFTRGRLQRFVRSHFKRLPSDELDACLALIL